LGCNGYEVANIVIKQPISTILDVAEGKSAEVVGMSGLLVESTVVRKENLGEMNSRGVAEKFPVLPGEAIDNDLPEASAACETEAAHKARYECSKCFGAKRKAEEVGRGSGPLRCRREPHRCATVRGVAAAPRTVHRRLRRSSPRSEVV